MDEAYGSGDGATFRELFATFVPRAAGNLSYSLTGAFGLATLSLFDGDVDRAMHEARLARRLGLAERRVSVVTAYTAFALHVAWLRGRLADMRRLADWSWADQPHPQNEALRAWVYAVGGDAAPLRSFVANFTDVHRLMLVSARYTSGSLGALTHAAVLTNDGDALVLANDLWADITEVVHGGFYPPDVAVAHYRGLLARAANELNQAAEWFRQAVVDHESLGSRPHAAVSRIELAATLTRRGRAVDRDEIASLVAMVAGEVRTVATAPA